MLSPSFSLWTALFLVAAVQGFFIAAVLIRWKRGVRTANRLLAALVAVFSTILLEYVLFWTGYIRFFPHMMDLYRALVFLFGPLLWWYLRSIYERRPPVLRDAWHLLPFVLAVAAELPWYALDASTKRAIAAGLAPPPVSLPVGRLLTWGSVALLAGYAVAAMRYVGRQPGTGAVGRWARRLTVFFAVFVVAYTSYFVLIRFPFFNLAWDYHISAAMTLCIYLIAYAGYCQPAVFEGFQWTEPAAPAKYRSSGLTPAAHEALLRQLRAVMERDALYREPALSLDALAERLGASRHHVSQVINEGLGISFFEYINRLRIEEAKNLLAGAEGAVRVIDVAYSVGFNNKVSFHNAFKRATGLTPTEYKNRTAT